MPAVDIATRPARAVAFVPVLAATPSDIIPSGGEINIITQYVGEQTIAYIIGALAGLALLFVIATLLAKFKVGRSREADIAMTIDDVGAMKTKGLLTDEEARLVKSALGRQVLGQMTTKKPVGGTALLEADPEVQELERIAAEKAAARQQAPKFPPPETPRGFDPVLPPAQVPAAAPEELDFFGTGPRRPAPVAPPISPAVSPARSGETNDVELPPEVVKMVQQGLITPEELDKIKQRLRARG